MYFSHERVLKAGLLAYISDFCRFYFLFHPHLSIFPNFTLCRPFVVQLMFKLSWDIFSATIVLQHVTVWLGPFNPSNYRLGDGPLFQVWFWTPQGQCQTLPDHTPPSVAWGCVECIMIITNPHLSIGPHSKTLLPWFVGVLNTLVNPLQRWWLEERSRHFCFKGKCTEASTG